MEKVKGNISFEELVKAFDDCSKHKHNSEQYLKFIMHKDFNLLQLLNELNNQTYEIGPSICFIVTQPKYREVYAADFRDRVVHHLIINKFNNLFESTFIDDTYNCRVGKGTLYGVKSVQSFIKDMTDNYTTDCWVLKCDIKNFFMSIKKSLLADMLEKFIRENYHELDVDWWVSLIRQVALHRPQEYCEPRGDYKKWEEIEIGKTLRIGEDNGMAIGNLTSQIFANFYLSFFDHYMTCLGKDEAYYGRYVDDFVIVSKNKKLILEMSKLARKYLNTNYGLELHPKKWSLQPASRGVTFLGSVIKMDRIYTCNNTIRKAFKAAKNTNKSLHDYVQSLNSYLGFLSHSNSFKIRKRIINSIPYDRKIYLYWTKDYTVVRIKKAFKDNK